MAADEQEVVDAIFNRPTSKTSLWIPKIKKCESLSEISEILNNNYFKIKYPKITIAKGNKNNSAN